MARRWSVGPRLLLMGDPPKLASAQPPGRNLTGPSFPMARTHIDSTESLCGNKAVVC